GVHREFLILTILLMVRAAGQVMQLPIYFDPPSIRVLGARLNGHLKCISSSVIEESGCPGNGVHREFLILTILLMVRATGQVMQLPIYFDPPSIRVLGARLNGHLKCISSSVIEESGCPGNGVHREFLILTILLMVRATGQVMQLPTYFYPPSIRVLGARLNGHLKCISPSVIEASRCPRHGVHREFLILTILLMVRAAGQVMHLPIYFDPHSIRVLGARLNGHLKCISSSVIEESGCPRHGVHREFLILTILLMVRAAGQVMQLPTYFYPPSIRVLGARLNGHLKCISSSVIEESGCPGNGVHREFLILTILLMVRATGQVIQLPIYFYPPNIRVLGAWLNGHLKCISSSVIEGSGCPGNGVHREFLILTILLMVRATGQVIQLPIYLYPPNIRVLGAWLNGHLKCISSSVIEGSGCPGNGVHREFLILTILLMVRATGQVIQLPIYLYPPN